MLRNWNIVTLLVDATGKKAAINREHVAGNEAGGIRRKIYCRAHQLFETAKAVHGSADEKFFSTRRAVEKRTVEIRGKDPRRNGVNTHIVTGPFHCKRLSERNYAGLAGGIRSNFEKAAARGHRRNVHNAPLLAFNHSTPENLAGPQRTREVGFKNAVPLGFAYLQCWSAARGAGGVQKNVHF